DGLVDFSSIVITQGPSHGTLNLPPGLPPPPGYVFYTPNSDYVGPDSFRYTIRDNLGAVSNEALVELNVVPPLPPPPPPPPNVPPVATDDSVTLQENTIAFVFVVGNDVDPDGSVDFATVAITQAPSHGVLNLPPGLPPPPGYVIYKPNSDYVGPDSFAYTVRDDAGAESNEAIVTLQITANLPPVAGDDSYSVPGNTPATLSVLDNDSDSDGFVVPASLVI